jgi:hypothetical protein
VARLRIAMRQRGPSGARNAIAAAVVVGTAALDPEDDLCAALRILRTLRVNLTWKARGARLLSRANCRAAGGAPFVKN